MANYTNIEDIIVGVDNATKILDNTKTDEGTIEVQGVDWFSYGGVVCNTFYVDGNSWIGLGESKEDLKFNRRDAAVWNVWREEGTFLDDYRFLRIRWGGYSSYSNNTSKTLMTYDVILFDTGDIMLYAVDIPSSYYAGKFTLGNLTYTKPTADSRYVTFYLQSDGSFVVDYAPISLSRKSELKYLLRDGNAIYTVTDGALVEVVGDLSASMFISSGFDTIPDGSLLLSLTAPELLCWTNGDYVPVVTATVQGSPTDSHDIVSDNIRVGHQSIYGITSVEATASDGATFLLSFDGGAWMVYDTDSSAWIASDIGMSATDLVAIPAEAWSTAINSAMYMQLKATLDGVDTVTQVKFNFDNEALTSITAESEG